ncbi:MAG: NlpC/P60 family protein [Spirochaetia bacterium]|nr:NlpC/P60 family protein [Spirochaetia bacterium]
MKLFIISIYTFFFIFISSPSYGETTSEIKIKNLLEKYCAESVQESKFKSIRFILQKLPPVTAAEGIDVLEYILPQACFKNYPDWLMDRTINLAVYAYHDGRLKHETLKYMNELIPSMSVGKEDYISYGIILEHLLQTGLDKEYIFDILFRALEGGYTPAGTEALSYYYINNALETKSHIEALDYALNTSKTYKSQDRTFILNHIFNPEEEKNSNGKKVNQEQLKTELEEKIDDFWIKHKNKIKIREKFKKLESQFENEKLLQFLTSREGIPYGYRMNKDFGADVIGLISIVTKTKVEELPYTYNSYCMVDTVRSTSSLKTGDLILFSSESRRKEPTAMGIYLNNMDFLFITISKGMTKASLNDDYYKSSFIKGCRIIN